MGYTLSFDASQKCTKGQIRGLLRHICRDVDAAAGKEVRHSNPNIDPARTRCNHTLVSDGSGGYDDCTDAEQIMGAISRRLKAVKKPLRKDAVVLRPLILQLDPEWYAAGHTEKEEEKAAVDMALWAEATFGQSNIAYVAIHNDEASPHLHVGLVPVTDDGRLSQKDWFPGPSALRDMHNDLREYMAGQGYDIEMGRKKPGKHARRMTEAEYRDFQQLKETQAGLDRRAADLDAREAEAARMATERAAQLDAREKDMDERAAQLKERADKLDARERAVEAREKAAEQIKGRALALKGREMDVEAAERKLKAREGVIAQRDEASRKMAAEAQRDRDEAAEMLDAAKQVYGAAASGKYAQLRSQQDQAKQQAQQEQAQPTQAQPTQAQPTQGSRVDSRASQGAEVGNVTGDDLVAILDELP